MGEVTSGPLFPLDARLKSVFSSPVSQVERGRQRVNGSRVVLVIRCHRVKTHRIGLGEVTLLL